MRFRGHVAAGAAFFGLAWAAGIIPNTIGDGLVSGLTCFIGTMVPDLDHPRSKMGRALKPISLILAKFSDHERGRRGAITHSLAAMAVFTVLWTVISTALLGMPPQASVIGFMVGYSSHLFADCLTKGGTPLLWFPGIGHFPSLNGGRLALTSMKTGGSGEFVATAAFLAVAGLSLFV